MTKHNSVSYPNLDAAYNKLASLTAMRDNSVAASYMQHLSLDMKLNCAWSLVAVTIHRAIGGNNKPVWSCSEGMGCERCHGSGGMHHAPLRKFWSPLWDYFWLLHSASCWLCTYAASLLCAHVRSGLVVKALTSVQKVFGLIPAGNKKDLISLHLSNSVLLALWKMHAWYNNQHRPYKGAVVDWDNEDTQNFMHTVGRVAPMLLSHSVYSKTEVSSYSVESFIINGMW